MAAIKLLGALVLCSLNLLPFPVRWDNPLELPGVSGYSRAL
jgi:hypothetical protein